MLSAKACLYFLKTLATWSSTHSFRINITDAHYKRFVRIACLPVQNKVGRTVHLCDNPDPKTKTFCLAVEYRDDALW